MTVITTAAGVIFVVTTLLICGCFYWLGWMHGRSEIRILVSSLKDMIHFQFDRYATKGGGDKMFVFNVWIDGEDWKHRVSLRLRMLALIHTSIHLEVPNPVIHSL